MNRLIATAIVTIHAATCFAAEFRGIPADTIAESFPYSLSSPVVQVSAISGDGSTIGGSLTQTGVVFDCAAFDCGTSAFLWTHHDSQRRPLGELALSPSRRAFPKTVSALSFDGSTALVSYEYRHYESGLHRNDAVTPLRQTINTGEWLTGFDMSSNAGVVVGSLGNNPFKWTEESGLTELIGVASGTGFSASGISGDGSTILLNDRALGRLFAVDQQPRNSMRWTESDGPSELQPLDGFGYSNATSISYSGSIVVGSSVSSNPIAGSQATMWVDSLPIDLEGSEGSSIAFDVSADGQSVVGSLNRTNPLTDAFFLPEAMLWRNGKSYRLEDLLANEFQLGDSVQGWSLTSATAVSDNGTVIAGQGISPDGQQSAWVAILTVPEPSSCVLAAIASIAITSAAVRNSSVRSKH